MREFDFLQFPVVVFSRSLFREGWAWGSVMRTEVTGNTYFSDIDFEKNLSIKNVDFRGTTTLNNRKFAGSVIFEFVHFRSTA